MIIMIWGLLMRVTKKVVKWDNIIMESLQSLTGETP